jgi:dihydroxyacetone kinase-like protein
MSKQAFAAILADVCDAVIAHRDELSRLDAALGDGDHGTSMAKAFGHVKAQLDPAAGLSDLLRDSGMTLLSVGGAMGPLFGSAFLAAADAVKTDTLDGATVAAMLEAADAAIVDLGHATLGDKTMLDALRPAAQAARAAAGRDESACAVFEAAARAARTGAEATATLVARIGRASRLGPRSVGYRDPGAMSTALILETFSTSARRHGGKAAGTTDQP